MEPWIVRPEDSSRYDKRLAVIVPYRNRPQHLMNFVPHIAAYFRHDKLDRRIAMSLHIVEQAGSAPFNGGKLKNVGFALARGKADYVCFHDVDYLPLWADYSFSPRPARLIWHGLPLQENWEQFLGGVLMFDNPSFERINGYPNTYWGWGFEDRELGARLDLAGIAFEKRDGFYRAIPHQHQGMTPQGTRTAEAESTRNLFHSRTPDLARLMKTEGLSDLTYKVLVSEPIVLAGGPLPNATHHVVDIG
jgi:hypothetical protein